MNFGLYGQSLAYGNTDGTTGLSPEEISGMANSYLSENNANEAPYAGVVKVNLPLWWGVEVPITWTLLQKGFTSIGFAKVAHGGRAIAWFMKGDASGAYTDFISTIADVEANDGQPLKYLIWIQGSSDATNSTLANAYQANLTQLVADLRADVNPDLSVIVVGENDQTPSDYAFIDTVRTAQEDFCTADGNAVYVDTNIRGPHHKGNDISDIHLSSYGNLMYADRILLSLTEKV